MRHIVFAEQAERELLSQIDYLIQSSAHRAARDLQSNVQHFLFIQLVAFPESGRPLPHRNLWEVWVPRTRLVLWYRFTEDALEIVHVWHTAQNRHLR